MIVLYLGGMIGGIIVLFEGASSNFGLDRNCSKTFAHDYCSTAMAQPG